MQQLDRPRGITIAKSCKQAVTRIRVSKPQPMLKTTGVAPHALQMLGSSIEVASEERRLSNGRQQPLKRPNDVSGPISNRGRHADREPRLANTNSIPWMTLGEMVRRHSEVRGNDRGHVQRAITSACE